GRPLRGEPDFDGVPELVQQAPCGVPVSRAQREVVDLCSEGDCDEGTGGVVFGGWEIVGEVVAVPNETFLGENLAGPRTGRPPGADPALRGSTDEVAQQPAAKLDLLALGLLVEQYGDAVLCVAVPADLVPGLGDGDHRVRVPFGEAPADVDGGPDTVLVEHLE